jgi:hypothetical protein
MNGAFFPCGFLLLGLGLPFLGKYTTRWSSCDRTAFVVVMITVAVEDGLVLTHSVMAMKDQQSSVYL